MWVLSDLSAVTTVCVKNTTVSLQTSLGLAVSGVKRKEGGCSSVACQIQGTRTTRKKEPSMVDLLISDLFNAFLYPVLESIRCFQGPECLPYTLQGSVAWTQGKLWWCFSPPVRNLSNDLTHCTWERLLTLGSHPWYLSGIPVLCLLDSDPEPSLQVTLWLFSLISDLPHYYGSTWCSGLLPELKDHCRPPSLCPSHVSPALLRLPATPSPTLAEAACSCCILAAVIAD